MTQGKLVMKKLGFILNSLAKTIQSQKIAIISWTICKLHETRRKAFQSGVFKIPSKNFKYSAVLYCSLGMCQWRLYPQYPLQYPQYQYPHVVIHQNHLHAKNQSESCERIFTVYGKCFVGNHRLTRHWKVVIWLSLYQKFCLNYSNFCSISRKSSQHQAHLLILCNYTSILLEYYFNYTFCAIRTWLFFK